MKISKRLKTIADMVDTEHVYDIGCDHGYLDIYLGNNKNISCTAIDKSESIIKHAVENVKKEGLENKITVIVNDGLDGIKVLSSDTVILSGLGTNTILQIIRNHNIETLIIQSNDDLYMLRDRLSKKGYYIEDEKIIYEGKYYIIIKFKKGKIKYKKIELFLGPILLKEKNKIFVSYLEKRLYYFSNLLKSIPNSKLTNKIIINKKIGYIKKALK